MHNPGPLYTMRIRGTPVGVIYTYTRFTPSRSACINEMLFSFKEIYIATCNTQVEKLNQDLYILQLYITIH